MKTPTGEFSKEPPEQQSTTMTEPRPPPTHHPSFSPPLSHSPLHRYCHYLRAYFGNSSLPTETKWQPSKTESYINLAVIRREKVTHKELLQFTLATLHGDVDVILEVKEPVEIEHILDSKPGKTLHCILVEGAPGVGKTTLAWHLCHRWGRGDLFQQYILVILVKLREEVVRKAGSLADLLISQEDQQNMIVTAEQLKETNGKKVLVILEGLDEFPMYLLKQRSVITEMLSGTLLPRATILVTSRPSATVQLWDRWKHRISRHIEVLGFTKENIALYISTNLDDDECRDFEKYLAINTHIRSLMYIPINCTIVIAVYKDCCHYDKPLPRTITELYTCLVQSILRRYLKSHSHEKLQTLTSLPPPVHAHFQALKELAYDGVMNQQYIYTADIEDLGLMDVVVEQHPFECSHSLSYNFLHFSIQEFLAAHYISTMPLDKQEKLLQKVCSMKHLRNTCRFLAGITRFKGVDRKILRKAIYDKGNKKLSKQDEEDEKSKYRLVQELLESTERLVDHVNSSENNDDDIIRIVSELLMATERFLERKNNILEAKMEEWRHAIDLLKFTEMLMDSKMRKRWEIVGDLLDVLGRLEKQLNQELESIVGKDGIRILYNAKELHKITREVKAGIIDQEAYYQLMKNSTLSVEQPRFVEKEKETKLLEALQDMEYEESGIVRISSFALQILYECEDCGILETRKTYEFTLTDYSPLIDFTTVGYCITHSRCGWRLQLGQGADDTEMQSTEGIEMLAHELKRYYSDCELYYTIKNITIYHKNLDCTQQLLRAFPNGVYLHIQRLQLHGAALADPQPLPQCLPQVLSRMRRLQSLIIEKATPDTLTHTLQSLNSSCLSEFQLSRLELSPSVMNELCSSIRNRCNTLVTLNLHSCGIDDKKAFCLAPLFLNLTVLGRLYLNINDIHDEGAFAIVEATCTHKIIVNLRYNRISEKGRKKLAAKYKHLLL